MIPELFKAIDRKDTARFVSFLAPESLFRFGNAPPVKGRDNIAQYVQGFFDSVDSLSHTLIDVWDVPGGIVCHGHVAYTRLSGTVLAVPFTNVFKIGHAGIAEYLIFADTSQLYS